MSSTLGSTLTELAEEEVWEAELVVVMGRREMTRAILCCKSRRVLSNSRCTAAESRIMSKYPTTSITIPAENCAGLGVTAVAAFPCQVKEEEEEEEVAVARRRGALLPPLMPAIRLLTPGRAGNELNSSSPAAE
jgi:hypothetical protein